MTETEATPAIDPLANQPIAQVERDGVHYTILGTAHVSQASVDAVHALAAKENFDVIAVELCEGRYQAMTQPDALAKLDLFRVIREGKIGLVAANLALSAYQRRLAEQLGVEPGAELKAAIDEATTRNIDLQRIDRDVGLTLRRTYAAVGFWRKLTLMSGMAASLLVDDEVAPDEIERLKQGDILESSFQEFAKRDDKLYGALIDERDQFMAAKLRQGNENAPGRKVLVVIGAGHLAGLSKYLAENTEAPQPKIEQLQTLPQSKPWGKWFGWAITAFLLGGFAWGFSQGANIGTDLIINWVLLTGLGGALGCLLAGGHPTSIAAAFIASPLTPFHPALASGMVSASVEAYVRKPTVADFSSLRDDVAKISGWWRNRVARVLVNFFLTNLGTVAGVYLAGFGMLKRML